MNPVVPGSLIAAVTCAGLVYLIMPSPDRARSRLAPVADWVDGRPGGAAQLPVPIRAATAGGAALITSWLLWGLGSLIAIAIATVAAGALFGFMGRLELATQARDRERMIMDLPVALELLVSCLSSGMPLREALPRVSELITGPLGRELGRVTKRIELGDAEESSWRVLAAEPILGRIARDAARAAETGAPLAEIFVRHADDARAERQTAVQARARTAGVRSVLPVTLCFLPAFFLVGVVPVIAGAVLALLPS